MKYIRFSENWDKIKKILSNEISKGDIFTTIRWGDKYGYYSDMTHKIFSIVLKLGRCKAVVEKYNLSTTITQGYMEVCTAKIVKVEKRILDELSLEEIQLDTYEHYTREDFTHLMGKFYGRKGNYKKEQSELTVIYLEIQ